jgi:outer membrane receptor for ferrienterochelin and colicins
VIGKMPRASRRRADDSPSRENAHDFSPLSYGTGCSDTSIMQFRLFRPLAILCLAASPVAAQTPRAVEDLLALDIADLMKVEVVSAASKFAQPVTDAPSSISIITADEIHRFGHRTLADVLRSVRGFYTADDHNYAYVGVRGLSRPGDYNTRVLLLIDGHRVNDPIYDMAPIGTDFPVDLSLVERIEVIRGPGSSLYGTNAFLGVINVVTRPPNDLHGLHASAAVGSHATGAGAVTVGGTLGRADVAVSASGYGSQGMSALYFPEFDSPATSNGIAKGLDDDQAQRLFASASIGRLSLRASHLNREKKIPTAAFGTIFGDPRANTDDQRTYVDVAYRGVLGKWSGVVRTGWDKYDYTGVYPFDYGEGIGEVLWQDGASASSLTGEVTVNRRAGRHFVTLGTEVRHFLQADQTAAEGASELLHDRRKSTLIGAYAQDEFSLVPSRLALTVGLRTDRHDAYGTQATPRAGLVYRPSTRTSLKLLHGRAFRAANYYERFYYSAMETHSLEPEHIATTEGVWEQYIGKHFRTALSVYNANLADLITQRHYTSAEDANAQDGLLFVNVDRSRSTGLEGEIEGRWASGLAVRASAAASRTRDRTTGARLSNSPPRLASVNVIVPAPRHVYVGLEGQYVGERLGVRGQPIAGFYLQNVNLTFDRLHKIELAAGVRNLFNTSYADPGAEEHLPQSIPQDRRTLTFTVGVRF